MEFEPQPEQILDKEWYTKAAIIYLYKYLESGCKKSRRNELAKARLCFDSLDELSKKEVFEGYQILGNSVLMGAVDEANFKNNILEEVSNDVLNFSIEDPTKTFSTKEVEEI